jgi:hypothetical protein
LNFFLKWVSFYHLTSEVFMNSVPLRRFHYHGTAHAMSLQFHRPVDHLIEVQAATSLPTTGGHGNARVDNFRFKDLVSFKAGYSHVSGSEQKDGDKVFHTTLVTSVVEGLNLLDVVTADRIVARLSASYEFGEEEARILLLGTRFENLRILGCPVNVEFHHELFLKLDTFATIRKEFATNADLKKIAQDPFQSGHKQEAPEAHGVLLCSLVKEIQTNCPGVTRKGHHGLEIPKFGRIYLGEVLAEHSKRTVTMLRLELGSPVSAQGTVVQLSGNGHTWP